MCELSINHLLNTDFGLMVQALTHSSYANENQIESNERLELLGDAVISLACLDYLHGKYPKADEGTLTQMKSDLVNGKQLSEVGEYYKLSKHIRVGNGESVSKKTLGRAVEAVIGAYFLSEGYETTRSRLEPVFSKIESGEIEQVERNYKGELQKYSQLTFKKDPVYHIIKISGKDHHKMFTVVVSLDRFSYGTGIGTSIKDAEQEAAKKALFSIQAETAAKME